MEKDLVLATKAQPTPRELYIDGHKITMHYSGQENPSAVQNIRNTLICGGNPQRT